MIYGKKLCFRAVIVNKDTLTTAIFFFVTRNFLNCKFSAIRVNILYTNINIHEQRNNS